MCMASYPRIVLHAAWNSRKPCFSSTRRLIARCGSTAAAQIAGIAPSVGSQGDAYDNALAESVIGVYSRARPLRAIEEIF